MIVTGSERMLGLAEVLLNDIPSDKFARFASNGGKTIEANHPAFIYGHLSIYPSMVFAAAGLDGSAFAAPEHYTDLFEHGKECRDDADGSIYPAQREVVDQFLSSHRAAIDAIKGMTSEQFEAKNGIESMADMFPTFGSIANFLLVGHTMLHLGQLSTWRRAIGLGSAM